ncbi:MAG: hypothetical protein JNL32_06405, partial [Candidatus Kapabacteria bacterium]|nr:hypothetical protein [Candidatus Kapabacteria bacterium]
MATYHCIQTHYEHGIGDVRVVFALSDTYAGLFATTGVENVSIFELKSSKKDLELAAGVSAQDEQQIVCNEYLITTTAEQAAFDLFYSARDASVRVFVGVFINLNEPTVVCSAATADMLGVLQPDMKSQAVRWSGATYSASPNPRREWQARAITFGDAVLNQFTPKELVDGKKNGGTTIIPAIDSTWKTANVSDRLGWYHHTPSGTSVERKGVYNELVNFGAALVKLRDQFAIGLTNTGVTGYSVVFDDFDFDFEFVPSLPNNPTASNYNHDSAGRLGLNELVFLTGDDWESSIGKGFGSIVATDALKHDLTGKRSLDIFSTVADEQLFVHWRMFAPLKDEEKMSLQAAGNFLEMLYAIAYSFGMLVETYNSDANTLHVKFVSRQNMRKWR